MGCPQLNDIYYGYRYYDADTGRWLSRDPIGEAVEDKNGERHFNLLYGFVNNDSINKLDILGLWTYEFVTKTSGEAKYGDIVAIADKDGEDLKKLAEHWSFGSSKNWEEIRKGSYRTGPKVSAKTKVKKGDCFNLFNKMPKWYQDKVGKSGNGNCHYNALAYIDEEGLILNNKDLVTGDYWNRGMRPSIMMKVLLKYFTYLGRFKGSGQPGDIINHYSRGKGLGHSDVYLEKGKENGEGKEKLFVFEKTATSYTNFSQYRIRGYKSIYGRIKKQYRKK